MPHFIAMSGPHGCLPDHCEVYRTRSEAIQDLAGLFELGRTRVAQLRANNYLELIRTPIEQAQFLDDFGAEYCEIQTCDCSDPSAHSDNGIWE